MRPFLDLYAGYCFDTDYVLISCKGCHNKSISNIISNITSKPCRKSYQDHIRKFWRHILLKLSFLDEKVLSSSKCEDVPWFPKSWFIPNWTESLLTENGSKKIPTWGLHIHMFNSPTPKWQSVPRCVAPFPPSTRAETPPLPGVSEWNFGLIEWCKV